VTVSVVEPTPVRREAVPIAAQNTAHEERIAQLETTMAELQQEVTALRKKIDDLFGD
jgi:cell division protein FtsB